jgi:hypothetical protein
MAECWKRYVSKIEKHNKKLDDKKEEIMEKKKASKAMAIPRKKFLGALLSKITPDQYRECLKDFNDPVKGKDLHKMSALAPSRMLKELERRAYESYIDYDTEKVASNKAMAKVLEDRNAYKADPISVGMKKRIQLIEERLAGKSEDAKKRDREYMEVVIPYLKSQMEENQMIGNIRALLLQGIEPKDVVAAMRSSEEKEKALQISNIQAQKAIDNPK